MSLRGQPTSLRRSPWAFFRRRIVCVGDPEKRFGEDALRIMRALRFASELGFSPEKNTAEAAHKMKDFYRKSQAAHNVFRNVRAEFFVTVEMSVALIVSFKAERFANVM